MNFQEIIDELKKQKGSVDEFARGHIRNPIINIGRYELLNTNGGENEGDDWYSIIFFPDHDVYMKCFGYYSSYSDEEITFDGWSSITEVRPVQKSYTTYE